MQVSDVNLLARVLACAGSAGRLSRRPGRNEGLLEDRGRYMGFDRHRRTACLAVGTATLLASGALAAQSSAAQIALNAGCYLNTPSSTAKMTIGGSGFAPSTSISIKGRVSATVTTDTAGNFVTTLKAPNDTSKPGARKFTVTASGADATGQPATVSTTGHYSLAGLALSDTVVGFSTRITYYFGGFRSGKQIYGHYFIGKRLTGRKRFGKATGPCGTLKAKATGYPISRAQPDKWTVFYDNVKTFSKNAIPTYVYGFHKV
jgi:hypothetical protein